jgi:hypothetical protein
MPQITELLDTILDKFRELWGEFKRDDLEGYVLQCDIKRNMSLVLVQYGQNYWKTEWCNNKQYNYKLPKKPFIDIFNPIKNKSVV